MADTIVTLCLDAMRTTFEIVLASPKGAMNEGALRDAGDAALREIADAEARLSLFRRDSLLSHINRTAATSPVRLDADTFELLEIARDVWRLSAGAFDPTVAARMTALGLHQGAAIPAHAAGPHAAGAGFEAIEIDAGASTVRSRAPVALDLGAIAKGHALDLAGRTLREHGVTCALLHAGTSSVLAIGAPPGEEAWRVAIGEPDASPHTSTTSRERAAPAAPMGGMVAVPRSHASSPLATGMPARGGEHATPSAPAARTVELRDNALGVSGHHGRVIDSANGPVTHVLDPRTGLPAVPRVRLAAVTAPTAAMADAWSTAALVLGQRPPDMPVDMGCILL